MNQKGAISSAFGIVVTLVIATGVSGYVYSQSLIPDDSETIPAPLYRNKQIPSPIPSPQGAVCTQEAKQCPDGSYVGRTGPKCEFAECLNEQSSVPADWKTYINEQYGFEFQYPQEWILCDFISEPNCASNTPDYRLGVTLSSYDITAPAPTYCQVVENTLRCEKYNAGGMVAVIDWEYWEWSKVAWIRYIEKRIDINLQLRIAHKPDKNIDELQKKQFRQLLSSFKFTK